MTAMNRDLNDTLIFVKVVENGSFTAAARSLGLPKTTVSRKLRDLENRLGARLLNRTTRRLALTEAGTVYYEHCKRIAGQLDEAESAVHQLEGSPRGWLRVTAPYTLAETTLTPLLLEFRQLYPDVHLDILLSNDLLDLLENEIDVALRVGPLADSTLVARRLAVYTNQIYASEGYLAHYGEPVVPEDLQHHRALVGAKHRRGQRYCWQLNDGERDEEFEVKPVLVANDPFVGLHMLAADQGLMLANEVMIKYCLKVSNVRRVLAAWKGADLELNALFQGGRVLSPKVRAFVDFMAERMEMQCIFARTGGKCVEHHKKVVHPKRSAVSA
jgi:DNA-binding transcriptional LysR family regulator